MLLEKLAAPFPKRIIKRGVVAVASRRKRSQYWTNYWKDGQNSSYCEHIYCQEHIKFVYQTELWKRSQYWTNFRKDGQNWKNQAKFVLLWLRILPGTNEIWSYSTVEDPASLEQSLGDQRSPHPNNGCVLLPFSSTQGRQVQLQSVPGVGFFLGHPVK